MNRVVFKRTGNIITITLPESDESDESENTCSICGVESTKKIPVSKVDEYPAHRMALLKKITDNTAICKRCFGSLTALSNNFAETAKRNMPYTHTVALPYTHFRKRNGHFVCRTLKPDAKETPYYIEEGVAEIDPFTLDSFKGWDENAKIYEKYEAMDNARYDRLYEKELSLLTKDEKLLDELAAKFYMNLQKRKSTEK